MKAKNDTRLAIANAVCKLIAAEHAGISVSASCDGGVDIPAGDNSYLVAITIIIQDKFERLTEIHLHCHPQLKPLLDDKTELLQSFLPPGIAVCIVPFRNPVPRELSCLQI